MRRRAKASSSSSSSARVKAIPRPRRADEATARTAFQSAKGVVETVANLDRTTSSIAFGSGKQGWNARTLYTVSVDGGGSYEIKVGLPAAPPPPP